MLAHALVAATQVLLLGDALDMVLLGRARHVGLFAQPTRLDAAAAVAALDRFCLAGAAGRPFHDLSGGQRQMVWLGG